MLWPETGLNRRRRPFQGVNKQYLQLLTRRRDTSKYAEIRVKRLNHGWGSRVEDFLIRATNTQSPNCLPRTVRRLIRGPCSGVPRNNGGGPTLFRLHGSSGRFSVCDGIFHASRGGGYGFLYLYPEWRILDRNNPKTVNKF